MWDSVVFIIPHTPWSIGGSKGDERKTRIVELAVTSTLIRATPPLSVRMCMHVYGSMYMCVYVFIPHKIDFVRGCHKK